MHHSFVELSSRNPADYAGTRGIAVAPAKLLFRLCRLLGQDFLGCCALFHNRLISENAVYDYLLNPPQLMISLLLIQVSVRPLVGFNTFAFPTKKVSEPSRHGDTSGIDGSDLGTHAMLTKNILPAV
jgi:hypothetical protein